MSNDSFTPTSDYLRVVGKFDDCRPCLARCLERHGIDPYNTENNNDRPWHELLIEKVDLIGT